ncbi:UNVERIFIED_CONTAM: hypothetical protein Slati_4469500 [Sesamum latifolium]|uniref:Retrotransposon gag domain-containing protein n=1 Tax=Sesamum latifolium TaxID=2727402 RepID=A0AAW2SRH5_9LAMI
MRNRNGGIGEIEGISEHAPQEEVQQPFGPRREEGNRRPGEQEDQERVQGNRRPEEQEDQERAQCNRRPGEQEEQERVQGNRRLGEGGAGASSPPPMIQLTPSALRQMIEDASAQAASWAVAQYIAEHVVPPRPPRHPRRGHRVDLAPGNDEQGPADQQSDDQLEEEVESRPSLPEVELPPPPPPPKKAPPEEHKPQKRDQTAARQASIEKTKNAQAFPLAVAPPRRCPLATHVLAEAIQPGIKIPNLSEYNGVGDPQDHLDQFLARADLLDISDAAYCKLFRTTLSGKAMVWFNQLPLGTIETFDQLSQRFLHHFSINKRYPKTASYLFTIVQHEHEGLREEAPNYQGRVISKGGKIHKDRRDGGQKVNNSNEKKVDRRRRSYAPKGRRERKHMPPNNLAYYTPLSAPRAELLAVAIQQGLVRRPPPMQDNPKRMKYDQFCRFHEDRGHDTEDCYNLRDEIERLVQKGHSENF